MFDYHPDFDEQGVDNLLEIRKATEERRVTNSSGTLIAVAAAVEIDSYWLHKFAKFVEQVALSSESDYATMVKEAGELVESHLDSFGV